MSLNNLLVDNNYPIHVGSAALVKSPNIGVATEQFDSSTTGTFSITPANILTGYWRLTHALAATGELPDEADFIAAFAAKLGTPLQNGIYIDVPVNNVLAAAAFTFTNSGTSNWLLNAVVVLPNGKSEIYRFKIVDVVAGTCELQTITW